MSLSGTDPTTTGSGTSDLGSTSSTSSSSDTSSSSSSSELSQLANPQLFLQLLIAELQNQDPTDPMDPSTILTQTSALSQVEALQSMTTTLTGEQSAAQDSQADGLIGQTVSATVNGSTVSGVVSSVNLSSTGEPTLSLAGNTNPVPLSQVTTVS